MNYPVKFKNFKIKNIVSSCKLNFEIPLGRLFIHIKKYLPKLRVKYELEIIPGLIYRFIDQKIENSKERLNIVNLNFKSGNNVIAGEKARHQIFNLFEKVFVSI